MSMEEARRVLSAFGPDSAVGQCWTLEDAAEVIGCIGAEQFVADEYSAEAALEMCPGPDYLSELRGRLEAAGLLKGGAV